MSREGKAGEKDTHRPGLQSLKWRNSALMMEQEVFLAIPGSRRDARSQNIYIFSPLPSSVQIIFLNQKSTSFSKDARTSSPSSHCSDTDKNNN